MSDDTRTVRERAEEAARHRFNYLPWKTAAIATGAFEEGFLARDAEPTTVTAEQIENAARVLYEEYERVDPGEQNPWSCFRDVGKEPYLQQTRTAFRAAGIRIEGDPA